MTSEHSRVFSEVVQSLLEEGLSVRFRARGRSMLPAVRDGECLIVAPARAEEVDVGDIVLGDLRRGPKAHRIISVERRAAGERRFILRGDASLECDGALAAPQILGRVVCAEREGRRVSVAIWGGRLGRAARLALLRLRPALLAAIRPIVPLPGQ